MNILCFQITMFSKNLDVLTMLLLWFSYHSYPIGDHSYLCKFYVTLCINQLFRYGNTMLTYVFNNIVKAQRTIGTMVYHRFYPRFRPMLYPRFRPMLYPRYCLCFTLCFSVGFTLWKNQGQILDETIVFPQEIPQFDATSETTLKTK